jgi:transcriptional regulator with XRE-family HTH domain
MGAFRESLGHRIQQLRKARGLTQDKLAALVEVDPKYLGSVERGERSPSLELVERLIRELRVEPYEPFLFSTKHHLGKKVDEEMLVNMLRHVDDATRPLLVELIGAAMGMLQRRKS